jgi:hypothetical protein
VAVGLAPRAWILRQMNPASAIMIIFRIAYLHRWKADLFRLSLHDTPNKKRATPD